MSGPISTIVKALVVSGATPEMILAVVEAAEQANADALAHRRASDAARQAAKRERTKRDHVTSRDVTVTVPSRAGATRAEPETTLSEETQKQESKEERKHSPSARSASAKTLCPDDFAPSEATITKATIEWGYTPAEVRSKADGIREWSRGKGEKRLDWQLVLLGALRRDAAPRKTGPPGKPTFLDIAKAADAFLRDQDQPDARPPPYLRLAQ